MADNIKRRTLILQKPITVDDEDGNASSEWDDVKTFIGPLVPFGSELAQRKYGLVVACKFSYFHRGPKHPDMVEGNRFLFKDVPLTIVGISDFGDKGQDLLLNSEG
ncbi:hypothetical protein [Anaerospora hongkongensis]|uniref:hypothetical protein n=1 Tax=Anaerospora hongkongensis TaxID=244830 RepID=UPI002FD8A426